MGTGLGFQWVSETSSIESKVHVLLSQGKVTAEENQRSSFCSVSAPSSVLPCCCAPDPECPPLVFARLAPRRQISFQMSPPQKDSSERSPPLTRAFLP